MIGGRGNSLEDRVVERLLGGPATMKTLLEGLDQVGRGAGQRAVYKAVGKLRQDGVLVKAGKVVRVDQQWLREVRHKLALAPSLQLSPGESQSHLFTSVAHLDAYWKTLVLGLEELERDGEVFFYNPHNFWAYLPERVDSETAYYGHFAKQKLHAFFTVGGAMPADMTFKRTYQNDYLQIHAENVPGLPRSGHIAVLGDYVVTVRLPKQLATDIDALYGSGREVADFLPELERLLRRAGRIRLTVERNAGKARALKKRLSLAFYFWRPS